MKAIFCIFSVFILSTFVSTAQNSWPPAIEIKSDTAVSVNIDDKYWQLLEDPTGKLSIEEVSDSSFKGFHINTTRTQGYNYHITNYWLRYRFKNLMTYPVKITIPENVAFAWLYTPVGNKWKIETNGSFVPWSQRDGLKQLRQFIIPLQPGEEKIIYEKDIFDFTKYKPKDFQFTIGFANAVIEKEYVDNSKRTFAIAMAGLLFGVMLLAAIINLLFFRLVREKVFLYFASYSFFSGLYIFLNTATVILLDHPYLAYYLSFGCVLLLFYSIAHFVRYFLSTPKYIPRWDKFLVILIYLVIIAWTITSFPPSSLSYRTDFILKMCTAVVIYTYFPTMLGTVLFFINRYKGVIRLGIYAVIPSFVWLGLGYGFMFISSILNILYKTPYTKLYYGMQEWRNVIEPVCFVWLVLVFSWILFKRFQDMQQLLGQSLLEKERLAKEKEIERSQLIEQQKDELEDQVEARTSDLKKSLQVLQTTQTQLIQSEKMASLGELTAGIAHEIQNPLNFVNNFSEVNKELLAEMNAEIEKGNYNEVKEIAKDVISNEEKINHHGKRADAIVKGMLQHSQSSKGQKEPTDINALCDEYLRLAYHGLRAKDKSFNATIRTDFDTSIGKINIIPQDIGRVILNLITNAFYTTNEKHKKGLENYEPIVTVKTFKIPPSGGGWAVISVSDNGNGIPHSIKDKIFQPFFTTKPTGQGTGLGLSLAYDIVKAHGGEINVESLSTEGATQAGIDDNGTKFIIKLPAQ